MEQLQNSQNLNATNVESAAEQSVVSVGQSLRAGRVSMGWSVEDVVSQIKLAPRQIYALEADDFESLPETAFVRGFVRSYAKVLQLDPQPLLDALPGAKVQQVKRDALQVDAPFPKESSERRQNMNLLIAAFMLALLIAGLAAWFANTPKSVATDEVKTVSQGALVTTPVELVAQEELVASSGVAETDVSATEVDQGGADALPDAAVIAGVENNAVSKLRLVFDNESWTEITDKSGKVLVRKVYQSGEEASVEGIAPFTLVIGHAPKVHLFYQGKPVDLAPYVGANSDVARLTLE